MATGTVRDEQEQAACIREMLDIYDAAGVDAACVYTFARWDLATTALDDPEHDFDAAGFGVVRVLPPGAAEGPYAELGWEPKAAFRVMAEFGQARKEKAAEAQPCGATSCRTAHSSTCIQPATPTGETSHNALCAHG